MLASASESVIADIVFIFDVIIQNERLICYRIWFLCVLNVSN